MNTLFVAFWGGPSCRKSSNAGEGYARFKRMGILTEYIPEFPKELEWRGDRKTLHCQPYVSMTQFYRCYEISGKVRVAWCDSPPPLGQFYPGFGSSATCNDWLWESYGLFNTINILLMRDRETQYEVEGRKEDKEQALRIDAEVESVLVDRDIPFHRVLVQEDGAEINEVVRLVLQRLKEDSQHA